MEAGDIIVDGGNSYYRDDIDRAKRLLQRDRLRGCRHERRRLGARARLLPDDQAGPGGATPGCRVRVACTQDRIGATDPGREKVGGTAEHGYLHCGPHGAGHFVKMVHNGIEYGLMAAYVEGLNILKNANIGNRPRDVDAETTCSAILNTNTTSI